MPLVTRQRSCTTSRCPGPTSSDALKTLARRERVESKAPTRVARAKVSVYWIFGAVRMEPWPVPTIMQRMARSASRVDVK